MTGKIKLLMASAAFATIAFTGTAARAQDAAASEQIRTYSIPATRLAQSVFALSEQAGVQVVFDSDTTGAVQGNAVSGSLTLSDALNQLLAGTGLRWRWLRNGVVTIEAAGADGERVTGAVRVEGAQGSSYFGGAGQMAGVNGVNGSRDITATEGTGSFTSGALTIGSKVPQAIKDVPQSISVMTSERLVQQNVTDFTTALRQLPGVALVQGASSLENSFYSRGFKITSIQIDGGPPFSTQYSFQPQLDMSIYDHVELLRGASGLFNGYGDPGGTVNLVRKRPLDHPQFIIEAQAGSWNNYRVVADATSPLALNGRLRGRLVLTRQDNEYFYKDASDSRSLIYGIAELDATPTTLLTFGISYTRQDSVPWLGGLPRYQSGEDLDLPRSTSFVFPWNRWDFDTTELLGGLEQRLGSDWNLKLNVTRNVQKSSQKQGSSFGSVNPMNNTGPYLSGVYNEFSSEQLSAEAVLTGAFDIFGQRQEVTVGASRSESDSGPLLIYNNPTNTFFEEYQPYPGGPVFCQDFGLGICPEDSIPTGGPPINVFDFDPRNPLYTEFSNPLAYQRNPANGQAVSIAYINLRLTAFDRLHLATGFRWSRFSYRAVTEQLCTTVPAEDPGSDFPDCFGLQVGDVYNTISSEYADEDFSWPPSVSLSYDLTRDLTAYLSYADIYQSQAQLRTAEGAVLPPVTGSNIEGGMKWAPRDGRINFALSAYRIKQKGFAEFDFSAPFQELGGGVTCCWFSDPNRTHKSEGVEVEATGEMRRGWQIAASYTYNRNRQEGSAFGPGEGDPLVSIQPEHLYKLWTSYDFGLAGSAGWLSRLTLSGGINGQSSAYYAGSVCLNLGPPDPVTGASTCTSFEEPDYVPFEFTVPSYAVISARADYRVSDVWSLAVNLENILDKTYYQTVGTSPENGNWYGAPRSVTFSLRGKW